MSHLQYCTKRIWNSPGKVGHMVEFPGVILRDSDCTGQTIFVKNQQKDKEKIQLQPGQEKA